MFEQMVKEAYEEAKQLLSEHRKALDQIAAFLIEKETITGKEFMEIFHKVEGIDPEQEGTKSEERIAMNPAREETGVQESPAQEERPAEE